MATFNFYSEQGEFEFGLVDWHFVLELAERYGWRPAWTVFPYPPAELMVCIPDGAVSEADEDDVIYEERLLRDYFSNSGQFVTDEDAASLAAALERAFPDVPNQSAMGHKRKEDALPSRVATWLRMMAADRPKPSPHEAVNAMEWFSGDEKQRLIEFARFCREAGFYIQ